MRMTVEILRDWLSQFGPRDYIIISGSKLSFERAELVELDFSDYDDSYYPSSSNK